MSQQRVQANQDQTLLRRFEPIIRYTRGESFFPLDAATYIQQCSLWAQPPQADPTCLIPAHELTLDHLGQLNPDQPITSLDRANGHIVETTYFLKFIDPLNITEFAAYRFQDITHRNPETAFHAGHGRLARVGYASRLIDAGFTLAQLARGQVPGDTAAAAIQTYRNLLQQREDYCYYGRVVRRNGWVILQYWYLYAFNNWRSGFFGANDHEADWEVVHIYLATSEREGLRPEWVACSVHDLVGDDLRRHWDDPEIDKVGEHLVVYAGAGSHANYFQPGEYLPTIELPLLAPLAQFSDRTQQSWRSLTRQPREAKPREELTPHGLNIFRIPFVDYARGDGIAIGADQEKHWGDPILLDPTPAWALNYRGLWGLDARDPFAGENAPAGPLYNRDGTLRQSWYDPLGWAGVDKLPPPHRTVEIALKQHTQIDMQQRRLRQLIEEKTETLLGLTTEANAMQGHPHLKQQAAIQQQKVTDLAQELGELRHELAADQALLEALEQHSEYLRTGKPSPIRSHIRHAHYPASEANLRFGRAAEAWAAVSIGLLMVSMVMVYFFSPSHLMLGLTIILALFLFIEAGARKQLVTMISSVTNALAIITGLVLVYQFFWEIVMLNVLLAGLYIIWENIRELGS